jgi:hypothetical protein
MSHNSDRGSYVDNDVNTIKFNLNKFVEICKIMTHTDKYLTKSDVIFTMIDSTGQGQSFLSPLSEMLTKLYIQETDNLFYGSMILEYEELVDVKKINIIAKHRALYLIQTINCIA